jgi:hypothetical protein
MWQNILQSVFGARASWSGRRGRNLPRRRGVRPALEVLEDRVTPSAMTFAQRAGGVGADVGLAVAADSAGNVYVAGKVQDAVDVPGLTHAIHFEGFGGDDAFVASYTKEGDVRWAKHFGGPFRDQATAIAVDDNGNVYVTGFYNGTFQLSTQTSTATFDQIVLPDAPTSYFGNSFVAKMNAANGTVAWVTQGVSYAGAGGQGIALDDAGNVYSTGAFDNQVQFETDTQGDFGPIIPSATNNTNNSYLMKQDPNGNLIWVKRFGTSDGTHAADGAFGNSIAVDGSGTNIYVGGGFRGQNVDLSTAGNPPLILNASGLDDLFVERFDGSGNSVWAVRAGSPSLSAGLAEGVNGIALDPQGNVYIAGNFTGTADFGSLTLSTPVDGPNAVVARLDPVNGNFIWADTFPSQGVETATAIAVRNGHVYTTGYFEQSADFDPGPGVVIRTAPVADAFVSVLDTDGNFLAVTTQGGPSATAGYGIAVDPSGHVDTTGSFLQTAQFGPFSLTSTGDNDLFVYKQDIDVLPAVIRVQEGHILQLTAAPQATLIQFSQVQQGIDVTVNHTTTIHFSGIDTVVVSTGDANVAVQYELAGPDTRPADLQVHLGSGDDTLLVNALHGWSNQAPAHPWHIDVTGGAVEHATFLFGGAMSNLDLEDQLAAKKSTVGVLIEPASSTGAGVEHPTLTMHFLSGGGTNDFQAMIQGTQGFPIVDPALKLNVDGVPGDTNTLSVDYRNVMINAPQMVALTGAHGGDALHLDLHNVLVDAALAVAFTAPGDGGNPVSFTDVEHMPAPVDGSLIMTDRSGPFADDIRVIYDFNPQPEPPGMPQELSGSVELHVPHGDPFAATFELVPAG